MSRYQINDVFAGRYRLVKHLGMGGFSQVWKAEDQMAERVVQAVKIFAPDRGLDQNGIKLFRKEYALTVALNHPHLLKASYFDVNEGSPYLILPYCEQGSLYGLVVDEHVFEEREVAQILLQISDGLAYLHGQGILHQDVKPDNIFIRQAGHYVLADFGISTKMRRTVVKSMMAVDAEQYSAFTPAYAPPEKYTSKPTPSGDVFSLGVTLYELLTHDVPFDDIGRSLKGGGTVPGLPERYSTDLNALVQRCVSLDPSARPTAEELREVARRYLDTGHWKEQKKTKSSRKPGGKRRVTQKIPEKDRGPQLPPDSTPEKPTPSKKLTPGKIAGIVGVIAIGGFLLLQYLNQQQRQDQIDAFWLAHDNAIATAASLDDSITVYASALAELGADPLVAFIEPMDRENLQEKHDALVKRRSSRLVNSLLIQNYTDAESSTSNNGGGLLIPDSVVIGSSGLSKIGIRPSDLAINIDTSRSSPTPITDYLALNLGGCESFHVDIEAGKLNGIGPENTPFLVQGLFPCNEGVRENNVVDFTQHAFYFQTDVDCIKVLPHFDGTFSTPLFDKAPIEVDQLLGQIPVREEHVGIFQAYHFRFYRMNYGTLAVGFPTGQGINIVKICSTPPEQVSALLGP